MRVYRLKSAQHRETFWSGLGAERGGGRWNSVGTRMLYTSDSLALSQLEVLVNVSLAENLLCYDWAWCDLPSRLIRKVEDLYELPERWNRFPRVVETALIGDHWIAQRISLALSVPSAVDPAGRNVLINPRHPAFERAKRSDPAQMQFDPRLAERWPQE